LLMVIYISLFYNVKITKKFYSGGL
jgi:hypothetical protein